VSSLNSCSFTGRLGRNPETRDAGSTTVTGFSLAVDGFKKDDETLWLDVSVWGKAGENVARFCSKGSQVAVTGRIGLRTYEKKDGTPAASVTLDARDVTFIGSKGDAAAPASGGGGAATPDDDIPFAPSVA
jgi:single-strand DNA-binding protein